MNDVFQDEYEEILEESSRLLTQMQDRDRARARQRLHTAPHTLTVDEQGLLGDEYSTHRRRHEATQRAAREARDRVTRHRELVVKALRPSHITFRTALLRQLNDHAIDLAIRHRITVKRALEGAVGQACVETRCITVAPVTNHESYATVLHEIGHIQSPNGDSRQFTYTVSNNSLIAPSGEIGAWRWALAQSCCWTIEMQQHMFRCLHSYSHGATADEKFGMSVLLSDACLQVKGPMNWTWGELIQKCAELRGLHTVGSKEKSQAPSQETTKGEVDWEGTREALRKAIAGHVGNAA